MIRSPALGSSRVLAAFFACLAWVAHAYGDDAARNYPNKPIRILVGFQPGGGSDLLARLMGQKLTERWGMPVVTDNRSGAGGTIAMEITTKAAPDGYTLLVISGSQITNASLFTKVKFDILKSYAPVTQMTAQPYILLVNPSLPVKSVKELIALAKAKPGGLSYGSSGTGSSAHLGMELFNSMAGVQMVHVPYKGSGQALIDLLGGQISLTLASAISAAPHMKSGKLRALAVTTAKPSPMVPDLPSIAEAGVPGYAVAGWYGLVAPRGTSGAIVRKLNAEMVSILQAPEVKAHLANDGADAAPSTPQEFGATIENEVKKWTKVVTNAGIRLD